MHRLSILTVLALVFHPVTSSFAKSNEVIEQKVPNAEVVGQGRFTYMLWDLYDASLHAPEGTWEQTKPYALKLEYLRNLSGNRIADRSAEEIRKQGFNDEARLAAWYGQMKKIFPNVSKGTEIVGIHIPGEETRFYNGANEIGSIKDPEFGKWFFGIWLSEKDVRSKTPHKLAREKMKHTRIFLSAFIAIMFLGACSTGNKMEHYNDTKPELKLEEFFDGKIKGWGIVQDRSGKVVRRFDVDIDSSWEGDTGTLYEEFEYYDGETQIRVWTIKRNADGTYTGTADDILDEATGNVNGTALNWHYSMDLPVGDKTYRVKFDDWMWQMNDGILVNRSYIKKFGFTVAELTLFMQKQEEE